MVVPIYLKKEGWQQQVICKLYHPDWSTYRTAIGVNIKQTSSFLDFSIAQFKLGGHSIVISMLHCFSKTSLCKSIDGNFFSFSLQIRGRNYERVEKLFQRCLMKVLNIDLWKTYLNYVKDTKASLPTYKYVSRRFVFNLCCILEYLSFM